MCYCIHVGEIARNAEVWAQMPILLAISRCGSLDGAAEQLNVNRTTVGRRLKALEHKLGGRMFTRSDGEYFLTALGREFLAAAEAAEFHLMAVESKLPDQSALNAGPLRIAVAPHILPFFTPVFMSIARNMPNYRLEITSGYEKTEIESREADIAIRIQRTPPDYPLVGRKLRDLDGALYTSVAATDGGIVEITRIDEVQIPQNAKFWPVDVPSIEIDDILGKQELIAAGGIGRLPTFMGDNDPRLKRISELLPDAGWKLWLVSHEAFKSSIRIKHSIDMVAHFFFKTKEI